MIDQRALPARLEVVACQNASRVAEAIADMTVRGAPAIGVSAAFGLALAGLQSTAADVPAWRADLASAAETLISARPTAVNLAWAVHRILRVAEANLPLADLRERLLSEAQRMADEDVATNRRMAELGSALIQDGDTILHHCNTGALATVDWGTALGVIRMAHEQGKLIFVLVDETRPRLQGARLTAWELQQYGIPYAIISDGASGYFLRSGQAQKVFFGADRVAANGDVANKIGTYMLALAAHTNDVPVYSVVPSTTVDLSLANGDQIPIEERDADEVLGIQIKGESVVPTGAKARNPAFDVTPHSLLTAIVTEKGIVYPPFIENLARTLRAEN
ncbi:methylthioribose-1-phosphate isomerase [Longilinea arvoryzae]|uniref:Methylthioribose-1-phosphate isomerase n=2 Tax=Longilinea arvoryzae TaxID=360412 RepID=A0A0S7B9V5_9CHLR|nr:methylthioribose-1-phosphate isomerase [Longilinea arvoryzae]